MYTYTAKCIKVYDADTITCVTDLGFKIKMQQTLRLFGINAPEMRGREKKEGTISRDYLRKRILNKEVIIRTQKDKKGKYGRYLADVYINNKCINDELVSKNLAVYKDY